MRLDIFLFKAGFFNSRNRASEEIKNGSIKINGKIILKPSFEINEKYFHTINNKKNCIYKNDFYNNSNKDFNNRSLKKYVISPSGYCPAINKSENNLTIEIIEKIKWVSRSGLKLEYALKNFNFEVKNRIFLDIGSSTGGFTQVLLHYGASFVYSVDVGTSQLDNLIKNNPKVIVMENYNAKDINISDLKFHFYARPLIKKNINEFSSFDFQPDSFVMDVSFISTKKLIANLFKIIKEPEGIILFKPQFESEGKYLKKGIVKNEKYRQKIIDKYKSFLKRNNLYAKKIIKSPISGGKGNIEYLMLIKKLN